MHDSKVNTGIFGISFTSFNQYSISYCNCENAHGLSAYGIMCILQNQKLCTGSVIAISHIHSLMCTLKGVTADAKQQ